MLAPAEGFSRLLAPVADRVLTRLGWPAAWDRHWAAGVIAALIVLAVTWVLAVLVARFLGHWLKTLARHTETALDDEILKVGLRPFRRLLILAGGYLAVRELPLPPAGERLATGVILMMAVWVGARVATRITVILLANYGSKLTDPEAKAQFTKDYVPLLSKAAGAFLGVVGLAAVLHHFGQSVTSLVTALGIGGVAVGLAAKDVMSHMFAGFAILVDRPFSPGDRIRLATGEVGDVIEVGTRSTRVRLLDQNVLVVPNGDVLNTRIVNLSSPGHPVRATLEIKLAYGQDPERTKQLVGEVLAADTEIIRPAPRVILTALGDALMTVTASYYIARSSDAQLVEDRVRTAVAQALTREGVKPLAPPP